MTRYYLRDERGLEPCYRGPGGWEREVPTELWEDIEQAKSVQHHEAAVFGIRTTIEEVADDDADEDADEEPIGTEPVLDLARLDQFAVDTLTERMMVVCDGADPNAIAFSALAVAVNALLTHDISLEVARSTVLEWFKRVFKDYPELRDS